MRLTHRHSTTATMPRISRPFACVDSGIIGISRRGETPFWSTGFSGCIGVVMSGTGQWGALAHMNQSIQDSSRCLETALVTLADFVRGQTNDSIRDTLIYYGDPLANLGMKQNKNLTTARVKELMRCQNVIDLRRKTSTEPYGSDFVYDPVFQIVYTAPGGTTWVVTGLDAIMDTKSLRPARSEFLYKDDAAKSKLTPGLGHKGWFCVP